jgi:hypothetical protein
VFDRELQDRQRSTDHLDGGHLGEQFRLAIEGLCRGEAQDHVMTAVEGSVQGVIDTPYRSAH